MQYNVSVRKKDKGYQVIVSYKDGFKWRQKSKQGFRTQREAKEYGHIILKELDKTALFTTDETLKELTFKDLSNLFLETKKAHIATNTMSIYKNAICAYHKIHDMKLSKITPLHIQDVINNMDLSPKTINFYYTVVSSVFSMAVKPYHIIADNPCSGVKLPRIEKTNTIHIISDADLDDFSRVLKGKDTQAYYFIQIARYTGMRLGEIFGISWDDIDLKKRQIHVVRQVSYVKGIITLEKTKTSNSVRILPIPPVLCNILSEYKNLNLQFEYNLVLNPRKKYCVRERINKGIKIYGSNLSAHSLRHTYATKLLANGVDIKTVSTLLGDTVLTVMQTYVHYSDKMKAAATNAVANIFG